MKLNNVDAQKAAAFASEVLADKSKAIKTKKVSGEWNLQEGHAQFSATLEHATGKTLAETDAPPFLGGAGQRPDPVQYCLFGVAACFAQTFASVAAEKGVKLRQLSVSAENKVNLSAALGIGNEPPTEMVKITVSASASDNSKLLEIEELSRKRCPGVYCLTHPIKLETELKIG
ncbi:MAG: OsmC family protein [Candidatus Anstonellaceae archaeon]